MYSVAPVLQAAQKQTAAHLLLFSSNVSVWEMAELLKWDLFRNSIAHNSPISINTIVITVLGCE